MTIAPPPQAASTSVAVHQLGGLFNALGEAAIVVAADGTVAYANQRTLQLCNDGEIPTTLDAWLRCEDGPIVPGGDGRVRLQDAPDKQWRAHSTAIDWPGPGAQWIVLHADGPPTSLRDALDIERDFLPVLLAQLQVGLLACDAEGRIVVHNHLIRRTDSTPELQLTLDDWTRGFTFFERDGRTPMSPHDAPLSKALRGEEVRNYEYAVLTREGQLRFRRANGQLVTDADGRKLGAVVALHDITEQRRAEEELRRRALQDPLTGLPNRALLMDRLQQAIARAPRNGQIALLFVDLDHFKVVNDGLGHSVGDALLVVVGRRLEAALRPGDTITRLGGDEFIILCDGIASPEEIMQIADRLRGAIALPVQIEDYDVRTTASIGIAIGQKGDEPAEVLLRDADTAMYLAKERGRDRYEIFGEALRARAVQRMEAHRTLVRALEEDRLRVYYQPIVESRSGTIVGVEALMRHLDPLRGICGPGELIPVAEETGLVTQIDLFVLNEALRMLSHWRREHRMTHLYVTCNLSARTLNHVDLDQMINDLLLRHEVPATSLHLELTETALITATPATLHQLARLLDRGMKIGVDDFGTGYSSLTYLRDFPVSFLKIDRSFVSDIGSTKSMTAIVDAAIRMAHALNLTVTAEGVEELAQVTILRQLGCDQLQGFLFSRSVSSEHVEELFSRRSLLESAGPIAVNTT